MKRRAAGLMIFILIIAAVFASFPGCSAGNTHPESKEETLPVPENTPYIEWNEKNEQVSQKELEIYLSQLTPTIAIKKSSELKWRDICPVSFWVSNFSVMTYDEADYKLYNFFYADDADENEKMKSQTDKAADEIISAVKAMNKGSEWDDILAVHDELIRRTEFVTEEKNGDHSHDMYGALVKRRAVCQGYTYAFSYILRKMGHKCTEIYSDEHIWTKIESLSSGERYIDLTWDDYNVSDIRGKPYIHHEFFCLTKEEMEQFDEHTPEDEDDSEKNSPAGDNYFRKKNYFIRKDDELGFRACALEQFKEEKNLLELRFESKADYDKAGEWMMSILAELGYKESYYEYKKPELLIYCAGLYAPQKKEETNSD